MDILFVWQLISIIVISVFSTYYEMAAANIAVKNKLGITDPVQLTRWQVCKGSSNVLFFLGILIVIFGFSGIALFSAIWTILLVTQKVLDYKKGKK